MKKIFYPLGFAAFVLMFSCTKSKDHQPRYITIDTTLASGVQYELDLKPYGDADDTAAITQQATTYTRSEIVNSGTAFSPTYYFSAATGESGISEQVKLSVTEGHRNGFHLPHGDSTVITINFKVQ